MSLPPSQWYRGYVPTVEDFQAFAASVAPGVSLAQANAYTDAQIAQAENFAGSAALALDVIRVFPLGGTVATTRPDIVKITTVSVDVNGDLTVTGEALCNGFSCNGNAQVGGSLTVSHDALVGGQLTVTGTTQIGGQLAVNQGAAVQETLFVQGRISTNTPPRINGLSPYPNDTAAGDAGLVSGDMYFNTTFFGLSVKLP